MTHFMKLCLCFSGLHNGHEKQTLHIHALHSYISYLGLSRVLVESGFHSTFHSTTAVCKKHLSLFQT